MCTVVDSKDGWRWEGHKYLESDKPPHDLGPIVASGQLYNTIEDAKREAERWFYSIPGIVEELPDLLFYRY